MELRQDLPADLRRRFQSGRICLDFTHTGGEGEYTRWELLHRPQDASRFLSLIIGTESFRVRRNDMSRIIYLRAAITSEARARAAGEIAPAEMLEVINEAAANPPLVTQLGNDSNALFLSGTTSQALSTLARDAIDLFASPHGKRIRICEARDCELLLVDASRPGRRRWCSMEWCGDRQKKRTASRRAQRGDAR